MGNTSIDPPAAVLALIRGAVDRARIQAALRARYDVRFVADRAEMLAVLATRHQPVAAIIVETSLSGGASACELVRVICSSPHAPPVLAWCHGRADLRDIVLAGVRELLFADVDESPFVLRSLIDSAQVGHAGERAAMALLRILPPKLAPFVRHVTSHPETQRVSDVAIALGCNRKSLHNQSAAARVPAPQELLGWCRLAVAAELLAGSQRTIESVALQLDFPSDTALRNMMKRYTGMPASEIRTRGGARRIAQCLVAAIGAFREAHIKGVPAASSAAHGPYAPRLRLHRSAAATPSRPAEAVRARSG